jgi:hypothetical protein
MIVYLSSHSQLHNIHEELAMTIRAGSNKFFRTAMLLACGVLALGSLETAFTASRPQDDNSPHISTVSLPDGQVGKIYFQVIEAEGGKVPWNFSQTGSPKGISFDTVRGPNSTDTLNGTPAVAGDFNVVITVTDSAKPPHSSSKTLKLHVNP